MGNVSLKKLKARALEAFRRGDHAEALKACLALEEQQPDEPVWPLRLADVYRRLDRREDQLDALLRAADLYTSRGCVIQAIATCKTILSLDPSHHATQERLDGLCAERERIQAAEAQTEGPRAEMPTAEELGCEGDVPLEDIVLTDVVYGAQPAHLQERALDGASEIPLDTTLGEGQLDLQLPDDLTALSVPSPGPATDDSLRLVRESRIESDSAMQQLGRTPLFGTLDGDTLRRLIDRVRLIEIAEGEVLFRQGSTADSVYVIADGAVVPIAESAGEPKRRVKLAVLEEGDFFGEVGLVTSQPRNATIQALVDTRLLQIDRSVIWDLMRRKPSVLTVMLRFLRERLIDRLVRTSSLFSAFARAERSQVAKLFRFLEVRDGTTLIEQGHVADALFVLLAGRLEVIQMGSDADKVLAVLQPGDPCGERSLLQRTAANASVVASGKSWVLALEERRLRRILEHNPRLEELIVDLMQRRDAQNDAARREPSPFGDGDIGLI